MLNVWSAVWLRKVPMKVQKSKQAAGPRYPSRRQFDCRLLAGVAALGLGAAIGVAQEGRLGGDIAVAPRAPGAPPIERVPVDPASASSCTATNQPAGTNSVPPAPVPPAASTNEPTIVVRKMGEMPVEPKK